uniref:Putative secreted protein n=1 Tax=Ixodes ricinus TaxID=34613 RepID=A0A6B0UAD8_IXORI
MWPTSAWCFPSSTWWWSDCHRASASNILGGTLLIKHFGRPHCGSTCRTSRNLRSREKYWWTLCSSCLHAASCMSSSWRVLKTATFTREVQTRRSTTGMVTSLAKPLTQ